MKRRIEELILSDLGKRKMVFLSGPRQCGKTTLAKELLNSIPGEYLNWDISRDRKTILNQKFSLDSDLWIFDEVHKYRKWRNYLKGVFDEHHEKHSILVTGSAKLNLYKRGGDSLQGRYFSHHLHPFTLSEVCNLSFHGLDDWLKFPHSVKKETHEALEQLYKLSGFPVPFLSGQELEANRWRLGYSERLVEEDIKSLEDVQRIESLELLLDRLDDIAGSTVSLNSLREDLEVSFGSIKKWMNIFERIFACFRISPYGAHKIKAIKKEQKLYLWDWSKPTQEGARFENLIAVHLLRLVDWGRDTLGEKLELRYFRHRDGTEVDFILLRNRNPWIAIEVKLQEQPLSPSLKYLLERIDIPYAFQVFMQGGGDKTLAKIKTTSVRSVSAAHFLSQLP